MTLKLSRDQCQRRKSNFQHWMPKYYAKIAMSTQVKDFNLLLTLKDFRENTYSCGGFDGEPKSTLKKWKYWVNFYLNVIFCIAWPCVRPSTITYTPIPTHFRCFIFVIISRPMGVQAIKNYEFAKTGFPVFSSVEPVRFSLSEMGYLSKKHMFSYKSLLQTV